MKKIILTVTLSLCVATIFAQSSSYFTKDGISINGYDAVAYFSDNTAVEGNKQFGYDWQGATWLFKNQGNLEKFKLAPEKYAPQFGGYCAYGMSENHLAPTEPAAFTIVDDKLYLNYNMNVRELWRKDTNKRIETGNTNWKSLKNTGKQ
jgi:YHS domain-containing protein